MAESPSHVMKCMVSDMHDDQHISFTDIIVPDLNRNDSHTTVSDATICTEMNDDRTHITESDVGLSPFLSACIVVNYISAGYVILPWGAFLLCYGYILLTLTFNHPNLRDARSNINSS